MILYFTHYHLIYKGAVVGVSDFLMMTLAKGTVIVGKKIGSAVVESDVSSCKALCNPKIYCFR